MIINLLRQSITVFRLLRTFCDGSLKDGVCGAAFVVYASPDPGKNDDDCTILAWMSFGVDADSITAGELEAVAGAERLSIAMPRQPKHWQFFLEQWQPKNRFQKLMFRVCFRSAARMGRCLLF